MEIGQNDIFSIFYTKKWYPEIHKKKCFEKIEIFGKNSNFGPKSKLLSKIEILVKNPYIDHEIGWNLKLVKMFVKNSNSGKKSKKVVKKNEIRMTPRKFQN